MSTPHDTILIVDDNPTNLRVLVDVLRPQGYTMLVATSGERALAQLDHHHPDLILLDVMMPGIDGFDTCRRLKADPTTADIPVIFMTALSDVEHKVEGFRAGAVDYITKPFQHEEIRARIDLHLMLQRQKRELIELNATKDRFFSIIGHDLRGPFTTLLGFAEILADPARVLTDEQRLRFGAHLYQSARNAYGLLENLLAWARLEQDLLDTRLHPMDLAQAVTETVQLLDHTATTKQIALTHDVITGINVMVDANMLSTVLRNLVGNAIKYTPHGGHVAIRAQVTDARVTVAIADSGAGMSDAARRRIFASERPLSTEGTAGEVGTGLGLLLCREFVARLGGDLWAESVLGAGSTFYFTVPLAARAP